MTFIALKPLIPTSRLFLMISSEEFHQQLQAGQIQAALALIVRDARELDVTTSRLTIGQIFSLLVVNISVPKLTY